MHAPASSRRRTTRVRMPWAWTLGGAATLCLAAAAPATPLGPPAPAPACAVGAQEAGADTPAVLLPVVRVSHYRMAGRARLLLFWVGRDHVGSGRITWRGDATGNAGYELLIGTDPDIAPRRINRWGYIAEEATSGETRVLGLMSSSDEATVAEVQEHSRDAGRGGRFKALQARVDATAACTVTGSFDTDRPVTLHEAPVLIERVSREFGARDVRQRPVAPGVRPGFLTAVAELVGEIVAGGAAARPRAARSVPYVYNQKVHQLVLEDVEPLRSTGPGAETAPVRAEFALRTEGRRHDAFQLEFATRGPLAGVPSRIRYQPRWWLQAELVRIDDGALTRHAPAGRDLADVEEVQHRHAALGKPRQ